MKKIASLFISGLLLMSLPIFAFGSSAESFNNRVKEAKGIDKIIAIDDSEVQEILKGVQEKEKREILFDLIYVPFETEVYHFSNPEDVPKELKTLPTKFSREQVMRAKKLSEMETTELRRYAKDIVIRKVSEGGVNLSESISYMAEKYAPECLESISLLEDEDKFTIKTAKENIPMKVANRNLSNDWISKYYVAKIINKDAGGNILSWFKVEVDWAYENYTQEIVRLVPNTTYASNNISLHYFRGLHHSHQRIDNEINYAHVEKSAYVHGPSGVPLGACVVHLIFWPGMEMPNNLVCDIAEYMNPARYYIEYVIGLGWGGGNR